MADPLGSAGHTLGTDELQDVGKCGLNEGSRCSTQQFLKQIAFAEGFQASYICSGKGNAKMISMERWWNDADRGEPK